MFTRPGLDSLRHTVCHAPQHKSLVVVICCCHGDSVVEERSRVPAFVTEECVGSLGLHFSLASYYVRDQVGSLLSLPSLF